MSSTEFETQEPAAPVKVTNYAAAVAKMLLFSVFGIIFFFVPCINGSSPLLWSIDAASAVLGKGLLAITVLFNILLLAATPFVKKVPFLDKYMGKDGIVTKVLYLLGSVFGVMVFFNLGPGFLLSADTGGMALDLAGSVLITILLAGMFVTCIANFGMLHFVGTLIEPLMRPLYRLPGYAAMDAATSVACSAAVDVFMANKIYLNKLYTKRDVAIVASNFTICSLGFFLLLCEIAGIQEYYGPVVLTSFAICFVMPILTSRIPPLSSIPNEFCDGTPFAGDQHVEDGRSLLKRAWDSAVETADQASIKMVLEGMLEAAVFAVKTCAYVLSVATVALILGTYTPVFDWLGMPFIPLLQLFQIPNAMEIAPACIVGISEIAMPVMVIADQNVAPAAAFFVVVLSTVQVIFFTESANAIMESDIPLGFWQLISIFLLRTLLAIPMIALVMHLLF